LLAAFAVIERRSQAPLMPFSIFRIRAVTGSNVAGLALGAAVFGMIFLLTLYMQQVLGYSPIQTGLAWLAMSLTALAFSIAASVLVTKIGPKIPLVTGLVLSGAGFAILSQISAGGSYLGDLLPGMLVAGSGFGLAFVAMSIGALEGIQERDSGLASGLINTTQQVGGALGVGVLSTLALTRTDNLLAGGASQAAALTEGFQIGLIAAAAFAATGAVAALALIRGKPKPQPQETSEPVVTRARPTRTITGTVKTPGARASFSKLS
jgi:hypothetical protein